MDGAEFLLLKWDVMNNKQKTFILIIALGALAYALNQISYFFNWCIRPLTTQAINATSITAQTIIGLTWREIIVYIILVIAFTFITIILIRREQTKTKKEIKFVSAQNAHSNKIICHLIEVCNELSKNVPEQYHDHVIGSDLTFKYKVNNATDELDKVIALLEKKGNRHTAFLLHKVKSELAHPTSL